MNFFITWTFGLSSSLSNTSVRELFFLIRTSKLEVRVSNYPLPALLIRRLPEMDYLRSLRTNISRYAVLKANRPQKHRHAVPGQPYSSYEVSFKSIKIELLNEGYRAVSRTSDTFRPSWFALVLAMDRPGKNPLSALFLRPSSSLDARYIVEWGQAPRKLRKNRGMTWSLDCSVKF